MVDLKRFLREHAASYRQAADRLQRNADANLGAAQAYEEMLRIVEKEEVEQASACDPTKTK